MAPNGPHSILVAHLRSSFRSGLTRSLPWRLRQIDSILLMLSQREDEFSQALLHDLGKSSFESYLSEIFYLKNSCIYVRKHLKKWVAPQKVPTPLATFPSSATILAEPLGVVLVIAPWNFPLVMSLDPVIGAIAAGNAVVLKPSEIASATSAVLAKLLPLYLDTSAIRVVEGGVPETTSLLEQKWDKIFFTGSANVGRIVMSAATKHLTPVTLELGGKCPVLVDSAVDLDVAARRIAFGKWNCCYGQGCIAADYVLAEESIAPALVAKLKKTLVEYYGKDPSISPDHARIINLRHYQRLAGFLEDPLVLQSIVHGGQLSEEKVYIEPTILLDPPHESLVMKEEIFGPILPIIQVKSMDEAVDFVNARPKPLAVYVFTNSKAVKEKAVKEMIAGAVTFNDVIIHFVLDGLPFGGVGESGMGSYHGKYSFDAFSHPKAVLYRSLSLDIMARYPPFNAFKESLARCIMDFNYLGLLLVLLGLKR